MMCWLTLLALILIDTEKFYILGQEGNLKLFNFNQSVCLTECEEGLRHKVDKLVMIGEVNWMNLSSEYTKVVSVDLKADSHDQFFPFCEISLNNCSENEVKCYCVEQQDRPELYLIYINETAVYNMIVLTISSLFQLPNITSNTCKLPRIYGKTPPTIHVNNHILSQGTSTFKLRKSRPNVRLCCYDSPSPCVVIITRNQQLVASGIKCAEYHDDQPEYVSYIFTYTVCGNTNESISFKCRADFNTMNHRDNMPTATKKPYTAYHMKMAFVIICISGFLVFCLSQLLRTQGRINH